MTAELLFELLRLSAAHVLPKTIFGAAQTSNLDNKQTYRR